MPTIKYKFAFKFRVGEKGTSLKHRIANIARAIADKIDGRRSITLELISFPALSETAINDCLKLGLHVTRDLLKR